MSAKCRVAVLLCSLLLSSCALLKPPHEVYWLDPQAPRPASDAVLLIHYALYARNLGSKQLAQETERVRLAWTAEKTDFRLLQYAMALSVPSATAADHRRALQMIDPLTRLGDGRDGELRALASLMHAQLAEQRRLEDGSHSNYRRAEELEKKLEALKDIEKNLLLYDKTTGGAK
jgi:hypothetical protein